MEGLSPGNVGNGCGAADSALCPANAYTITILHNLGYPDYARAVRKSESSLFGDWCRAGNYKRDRTKREALIADRLGINSIPAVSYLSGFLYDIFAGAHHFRAEEKKLATLRQVASLDSSILNSRADNWCINYIISKVEPNTSLSAKTNSLDTSLYVHWRENGKSQLCLRTFVSDNGSRDNYRTRVFLHILFSYVEHLPSLVRDPSKCMRKKQAFLRRLVDGLPDDLQKMFSRRALIAISGDDGFEYRTRPHGRSFSHREGSPD